MHSDKEVDEATGKPLMILDYNATKAAVDRVDQLCHNYNVQNKNKTLAFALLLQVSEYSVQMSQMSPNESKKKL